MALPDPNLQGKSFLWAFVLCITLFSATAFWGAAVGLNPTWAAVLLAVAGFTPFLVQAITGYALDGMWVARFSRTEHPTKFWGMLVLRSEEHTSELQSLLRISYDVFCLKKK